MTVLLNSTFTGTNGAPWPSPWETGLLGGTTGGAVDIQSNRGRMRTHNGDYQIARADAAGINVTDCLIEATVRFPSVNEQYPYLWARAGGWMASDPFVRTNSYFLLFRMGTFDNDALNLGRMGTTAESNVWLAQHNLPGRYLAAFAYKVKFSLEGSLIRAKVWQEQDAEPAWQISVTDSTYSSGGVAASLVSGAAANSREVWYNDFVVNSIEEPVGILPSEWTNYLQRTTAQSPETNERQFFTYVNGQLQPVDVYVGGP